MAQDDLHFLMASMLFGGMPGPALLYLGLTLDPSFDVLTLAVVAKRELAAPGYRRAEVPQSAWTITRYPPTAATNITIRNMGAETWPTVRGAFLATTPDNTGLLLAFSPFSGGRIAYPKDSIVFPISLDFVR